MHVDPLIEHLNAGKLAYKETSNIRMETDPVQTAFSLKGKEKLVIGEYIFDKLLSVVHRCPVAKYPHARPHCNNENRIFGY